MNLTTKTILENIEYLPFIHFLNSYDFESSGNYLIGKINTNMQLSRYFKNYFELHHFIIGQYHIGNETFTTVVNFTSKESVGIPGGGTFFNLKMWDKQYLSGVGLISKDSTINQLIVEKTPHFFKKPNWQSIVDWGPYMKKTLTLNNIGIKINSIKEFGYIEKPRLINLKKINN